jgi:hypothetical protein
MWPLGVEYLWRSMDHRSVDDATFKERPRPSADFFQFFLEEKTCLGSCHVSSVFLLLFFLAAAQEVEETKGLT